LIGEDEKQFFKYSRPCDTKYMVELHERQPFTDHNGYELYGPFPWGRWQTLDSALNIFTLSIAEQANNNKVTSVDINTLSSSLMFLAAVSTNVNNLSSELKRKYEEDQTKLSSSNITQFTLNSSKYNPEIDPTSVNLNDDGAMNTPKVEGSNLYKENLKGINKLVNPEL
jgi:hypothetical protein